MAWTRQDRTRRVAGMVAALALALAVLGAVPAHDAAAEPDATPAQLAGPDRIGTAAQLARHAFAPGAATTALLARGDDFPDALAAAGLAGALDAPILLTHRDRLPDETTAALADLQIERVLLLGGRSAIGDEVEALIAAERETERLAGPDRFTTAVAIAHAAVAAADEAQRPRPETVVVVRGDSFADALTAGAPAFAGGWPILLVEREALPQAVGDFLDDLAPQDALVLGGVGAVGEGVVTDLQQRGIAVERVSGPTRTSTATALADRLVAQGWPQHDVTLARGDDFADALAAAPLAGRARMPILLAQAPRRLGGDTAAWLSVRCPGVGRVVAVGGGAAIAEATLDAAHHARLDCVPLDGPLEITFRVEGPDEAGAQDLGHHADATLADPRGWTLDARLRFRRTVEPANLTLRLAPAEEIAAAHHTCEAGRSCRVGDLLLVDVDRWHVPPPGWEGRLGEYRTYLLNHLVGHWLGLAEARCGSGVAPVMADQTALGGCTPGPWPTAGELARVRRRHVPPVTIAFGGDVHGEGRVRTHLLAGGNPLGPIAPDLQAADLAMINLETAVGYSGSPEPGKTYTFQAPPQLLTAARAAGVDVVSLANNHALDYGRAALAETIDRSRAAGLVPVGAGRDAAEAYAPALLRANRRTVAVVGLSRVLPAGWAAGPGRSGIASAYDVAAAEQAVRAAAEQAEIVVVLIHWGVELAECPDPHQRDLARRLTAAGADVVAGHHPHVLQGIHRMGDALVHYSLGNFVWYHSRAPSRFTGVWTVELDSRGAVADSFTPAEIDGVGAPVRVHGALEAQIRADVAARSPGGGRCSF